MLARWVVVGLILSPLLKATHPPRFGKKTSTMLSFDLRRKTKHHRERNTTTATATPAPTTTSNEEEEEEEMEFSLRVCLARLRARCTNLNKFNYFTCMAAIYFDAIVNLTEVFYFILFFSHRVHRTLMLLSWN